MAQPAIGVTTRDINLTGPTPADHRTIARGTVVRIGATTLSTGEDRVYLGVGDGPLNICIERAAVKVVGNCPGAFNPQFLRKTSIELGPKFGGRPIGRCACGAERTIKNGRLYPHKTV